MITSDLCDNVSFSCAPVRTRDLFLRYPDRLIYGTDLDTRLLEANLDTLQFYINAAGHGKNLRMYAAKAS